MEHVEQLNLGNVAGGVELGVKAVPNASSSRVVGVLGEALKVAVCAPPEAGKANKAIIKLLAEAMGVSKRDIELVSSPSNPRKRFRISGVSVEHIRSRLTNF